MIKNMVGWNEGEKSVVCESQTKRNGKDVIDLNENVLV